MTIRVAQVVTQMNRGGLETRLMDLYRATDRNKVQYDFVTCSQEQGTFDSEIRALGGRVFYGEKLSLWPPFAIPGRFESFFREHGEFRVVHAHMNSWCGPILHGARGAGLEHRIAHSRGANRSKSIAGSVKRTMRYSARTAATRRLAVSRTAGSWLFGRTAMSNGSVTVVPNAVDIGSLEFNSTTRARMRRELGLGNALTIIHVGNLVPVKNHTFLLSVFAEMLNSEPNARLLLVGGGGERERLIAHASRLGISGKVSFLGVREDVSALLQAADVFVFPSLHEGMPGAVLEAQAAGLPCVISRAIDQGAAVLPTTRAIELARGPREWADMVLNSASEDRKCGSHLMHSAGFDVNSVAQFMTEMYTSMHTSGA